MTLLHVAWFRFHDHVLEAERERHLAAVRGLKGRVPAVIDIVCGPNRTDRAGGFTHGVVVTLADTEAIQAYLDHPAHVPVANALKGAIAELRVMDLEV